MALPQSAYKDRQFLAVIGDEVLCSQCGPSCSADAHPTGLGDRSLACWCWSMTALYMPVPWKTSDLTTQHVTDPPDAQKNYLVVDHKTETHTIEEAFDSFTQERKDIAIVLINQHVRPPLRLSYLSSPRTNTHPAHRLPTRSAAASMPTPKPSLRSSRFPQRTTLTTPKRTAS
jgi:hypothetical protein